MQAGRGERLAGGAGQLVSVRLPFSRELWQKLTTGAGEGRPS